MPPPPPQQQQQQQQQGAASQPGGGAGGHPDVLDVFLEVASDLEEDAWDAANSPASGEAASAVPLERARQYRRAVRRPPRDVWEATRDRAAEWLASRSSPAELEAAERGFSQ